MSVKKIQLVLLAGGRSTRMGEDKSYLTLKELGGNDFFENALSLLLQVKQKYSILSHSSDFNNVKMKILTAVSCRQDQEEIIKTRIKNFLEKQKVCKKTFMTDTQTEPCDVVCFGGIIPPEVSLILDTGVGVCEAMIECLEHGACDTLFIPCDVPFLTVEILQKLIDMWILSQKNKEENTLLNFVYEPVDFEEISSKELKKEDKKNIPLQKRKKRQESLVAIYTYNSLTFLKKSVCHNISLQNAIPNLFSKKIPYTKDEAIFFQNMNTKENFLSFNK